MRGYCQSHDLDLLKDSFEPRNLAPEIGFFEVVRRLLNAVIMSTMGTPYGTAKKETNDLSCN